MLVNCSRCHVIPEPRDGGVTRSSVANQYDRTFPVRGSVKKYLPNDLRFSMDVDINCLLGRLVVPLFFLPF